jgi:hypothetical protein
MTVLWIGRRVASMDLQRPLTDADRQAAVAALRSHAGAGTIDLDVFGDRTAAVLAAATVADLDPVFADLPGRVPPLPSATPPAVAAHPRPVRSSHRRPPAGPALRPGAPAPSDLALRPGAGRSSHPRPVARIVGRLAPVAPLAVLFVAIWAATGFGSFWPVWPILGISIGAFKRGACSGRPGHRRRPVWV